MNRREALGDGPPAEPLRVRFITDSYSRAMNRSMPTWKWALWRQPLLVRDNEILYGQAG